MAHLYYLFHLRSCAAAPMGNKGGNISSSMAHQFSCGSLIAGLLQKLASVFFAILSRCTPLEVAACLHLAQALEQPYRDAECCGCNVFAVSGGTSCFGRETVTIALSLLILFLASIEWHVPRWVGHHRLLCRLLTAMSMHTLGMGFACTAMAFWLPTFPASAPK